MAAAYERTNERRPVFTSVRLTVAKIFEYFVKNYGNSVYIDLTLSLISYSALFRKGSFSNINALRSAF